VAALTRVVVGLAKRPPSASSVKCGPCPQRIRPAVVASAKQQLSHHLEQTAPSSDGDSAGREFTTKLLCGASLSGSCFCGTKRMISPARRRPPFGAETEQGTSERFRLPSWHAATSASATISRLTRAVSIRLAPLPDLLSVTG
jgi:hypothetical protein